MPSFYQINGVAFDDLFVRNDQFTEGGLWLWGSNGSGELGDNSATDRSSPVQTVSGGTNWKQVSASSRGHTAAIKTDGTLWLWGLADGGYLGDNARIHRSSPVQTISGGTNWKMVSAGGYLTAAIKTDGTLWTWGLNNTGQLGDNTVIWRSSPVQTVSGGTNWKMVACGAQHMAAIKTDGTLWLWGFNNTGQLGDNTRTDRSSPVQTVSGGTNWKQVAGGATYYTAAIKTDGTLWTWGWNVEGALGDNTNVHRSSPVQTISGGTNWKQVAIATRGNRIQAIKTDGTLWGWGSNGFGELGDNTITSKSSPVQTVSGGTNWKMVAAGQQYTAAIKTDGTLWTWGRNGYGALGDNTLIHRSSPVQTIAGGTNWKQVSCGQNWTAAIRDQW